MERGKTRRRIDSLFLAAACAAFALSASGCASMVVANPRKVVAVKEKSAKTVSYKNAEYGGPSDHTLAFGLTGVPDLNMVQVDPDLPPVHAKLGVAWAVGAKQTPYDDALYYYIVYLPPLAVGSKMATSYMFFNGASYYYITFPLNSEERFSFAATKPGLLYLGDFSPDFRSMSLNGVKKVGSSQELFCLRKMLPRFKGSEWEAVIEERIKELAE